MLPNHVLAALLCVALVGLAGCPDDPEPGPTDTAGDVAAETDVSSDGGTDPGTDPADDPGTDPAADPGADPAQDPGTDPAADPAADPAQDPAADPAADPAQDPAPDPAPDPGPDGDTGPDVPIDVGDPQPATWTYNTQCNIPPDPSASGIVIGYEQAFAGANVNGPLKLTHSGDGTNRIWVAERDGRLKVFPKMEPAPAATTALDFSSVVDTGSEGGFLGVAFHPDFETNGYLFTSYTSSDPAVTGGGANQFYNVLSRWQISAGDPNVVDPTSELIFLTVFQTQKNHNGGDIAFGPDGYLYMGIGDGGPQGDPGNVAQNLSMWLGKIIRIDVDNPESVDKHYSIPSDNPFAEDIPANDGIIKEIYAYGFRNPWRMSFDRLTGDFWVGDVGQGRIEEASIITNGTNAGWKILEGPECYVGGNPNCDMTGLKVPEVWYWHDTAGFTGAGRSITGGYVYRGSDVPALYGAYLYADWNFESVWAYKHGEEPPPFPEDGSDALFIGPGNVGSFGEDEDGEVYMLNLFGPSGIYRFTQTFNQDPPGNFPQTLTETGCFSDLATLTPVQGVFPYTVNVPLWSDTADKQRWFVLPDGGKITYAADGQWQFPVGTIFIKHFGINLTEGNPSTNVRLETRIMVQEAAGAIRGYTYRWNDEGTEAFLLPGGASRDLTLQLAGQGPMPYQWRFPSRQQCGTCHNGVVGGPLGLESGQLNNADNTYPELWSQPLNTLEALKLYDLFENPPADVAAENRYPSLDDTTATATERARAYLQSNCANCHRTPSPIGVDLDVVFTTALADMNACNVAPNKGDLGIAGATLLTPGDADASLMYQRMVTTVPGERMPPISAALPHDEAASVLADWINGLSGCP